MLTMFPKYNLSVPQEPSLLLRVNPTPSP